MTTHGDDETQEDVERWLRNFDAMAPLIRRDHLPMILRTAGNPLMLEAADEIERLRSLLTKVRAGALERN